jgi:hypothetical protein
MKTSQDFHAYLEQLERVLPADHYAALVNFLFSQAERGVFALINGGESPETLGNTGECLTGGKINRITPDECLAGGKIISVPPDECFARGKIAGVTLANEKSQRKHFCAVPEARSRL